MTETRGDCVKVSASNAKEKAKAALLKKFGGMTDTQGYVEKITSNLVPGVRLDQFESDLRAGDGDELKRKFRAVHSSAALAVNSFAPFKDQSEDLLILGQQGASGLEFEKKFQIVPGRRPSNLDVWIERRADAVAIESKLLEYLGAKKPKFAQAYEQMKPPNSEACWWAMCAESWANGAKAQYLDCAQLVKHYFGLRRLQQRAEKAGLQVPGVTLLYIFWEPLNWHEIAECIAHRKEIEQFASRVKGSSIPFCWQSYAELWDSWAEVPGLATHSSNLKARYEVSI